MYMTACARAYGFVFERHHISAAIFSLRSCIRHARACSRCACLPARARGPPGAGDGSCSRPLGGSAAKWTNVVWPIKRRQTNRQTNTHYSFIGIDTGFRHRRGVGYRDVCTHPSGYSPENSKGCSILTSFELRDKVSFEVQFCRLQRVPGYVGAEYRA